MEVEGIFSNGECEAMVRLAERPDQRGASWLAIGVGVACTANEAERAEARERRRGRMESRIGIAIGG